ncbi:MAG: ATP-binding protein [Planctomycetota bacterium]
MTLVSRVSAFFLIALAVILLAFSVILYGLSSYYLYHHFDQRLESSLNVLVASIEVEDDDVKWEPTDHTVTLGTENGVEDVRWVVSNERGQVVGRSHNLQSTPEDQLVLNWATRRDVTAPASSTWRFRQYHLAAPRPKPLKERDYREHAELLVTAALSTNELDLALNQLAMLLIFLPTGCWILAAIGGRWFCSKAIEPVRRMSRSARAMTADDIHTRLPVAKTGDELEDLGRAFNAVLDQVFDAYERQRQFAGDAAHQLRTPLTVLQGQIEVLLRRPRSVTEYTGTLELLRGQVDEFREIVEALLFLAQPDDKIAAQNGSPIDLTGWIGDYQKKWHPHPRWNDLFFYAEPDLFSAAPPELLKQMLDNLIGNALKYSAVGSSVTVQMRRANDSILLEVSDRGRGIEVEDVRLIFQPFFRSVAARQSGIAGTGLGLSIVSRIVGALGGRIECQSVIHQGTRFNVYLPGAQVTAGRPSTNLDLSSHSLESIPVPWSHH